MPRVSVHMPSYNHAAYVGEAIASVERQTFQDFEIVVTDDGSTDGTPEIIRALANPRVKLNVFPTNRGASRAANDAIRRSAGEYIALLSSDDVFLPHKLERQVAFLDAHPDIGAVFGQPTFIDHLGQPIAREDALNGRLFQAEHRSRAAWLHKFFFFGNCLCHPTILIRRSCYEAVGLYDNRLAALPDLDLWIRLVQAYDIHVMGEPLIGFRQLPDGRNASSTRPDNYQRYTWETPRVLRRYLDLTPALFAEVFAAELARIGLSAEGDRKLLLGCICIASDNAALHRLGLDLVFEALPADVVDETGADVFGHADFHRHGTGAKDVYNVAAQKKIDELQDKLNAMGPIEAKAREAVFLEGKLRQAIAALNLADQRMSSLLLQNTPRVLNA